MKKAIIKEEEEIVLNRQERRELKAFAEQKRKELKRLNKANVAKGLPEETAIATRVPIKWLVRNPKYQRALNESRVATNAGNFNYNKVNVKFASYRDGKLYLIDGKHTAALLEKKGYEEMYIMLIFDLTYEEEAYLFITQYEGSTKVSIEDLYEASIEAKIDWAIDLKDIFDEKKITVTKEKEERLGRRTISALTRMKNAYLKKDSKATKGPEAYKVIINTIFDLGWDEFDGGFKSDYLEIGCVMCSKGVTYGSDVYNGVISHLSQYKNPDAFMGEAKKRYSNDGGKHGEGSVITYVRDLLFDLMK